MNERFITKTILRKSEPLIEDLRKAYSEKLGVSVGQAETISKAIESEHRRVCKK